MMDNLTPLTSTPCMADLLRGLIWTNALGKVLEIAQRDADAFHTLELSNLGVVPVALWQRVKCLVK